MCHKCDYNITNLLNDFFRAWRINNKFKILNNRKNALKVLTKQHRFYTYTLLSLKKLF